MIRVSACQVRIDIDAPERTRAAVASAVERAADAGAELVVLPELALTGYVFADAAEALARAEELGGPGIRFFRELSGDRGLMLVAGWCEKSTGERPYNSAVVIDQGVVAGCYRKTHLWGRETEVFAAGDKAPPVLATNLGLIAPLVCYDLEFPEVVRAAALGGAELIVAPSNWPRGLVPLGERPIEVIKAQAAAAVNRVGVIVADRCGSERGQDWTGASLISGPDGYLLAGPASGEETVLLADIDLADCRDKRLGLYNDALADRRPHLYREPPSLNGAASGYRPDLRSTLRSLRLYLSVLARARRSPVRHSLARCRRSRRTLANAAGPAFIAGLVRQGVRRRTAANVPGRQKAGFRADRRSETETRTETSRLGV